LSIADTGLKKTAFVLAGGGSFGAIQVGMMHSLAAHGISPDMVVGSSVGAINGAYYAGDPMLKGVLQLETIWHGLRRQDVFPLTMRAVLNFLWRRDFLIPHDGIRKLVDDNIPYRNLEDAKLPLHIVTTDIVSGDSVVLSEGRSHTRLSPAPPFRAPLPRCGTRTCTWPTARSRATRRSGLRLRGARGASSCCRPGMPARRRSRRKARSPARCMP
jgi:predicted acylesterase/phospholipase RssA